MLDSQAKTVDRLFDLDGRVALITGASKGIGAAIARALAEAGAHVILSSRKQEAVSAVAEKFVKEGLQATAIAAHLGKPEELDQLVDRVRADFGGLEILVNNAGINPVYGPVMQADMAAFDKIWQVNLRGPLYLSRKAHPLMLARGSGSVINLSSIAGISPMDGLGYYSISKTAMIGMTRVLAKEWGPDGIRVNAICPGLIKTKLSTALWQNEKIRTYYETQVPLRRIGVPEDVAGLAVFLASDAAAYCTGGVYIVDGGETA